MEDKTSLINELVGKKIVVETSGGEGIKDVLLVKGEYIGNLLVFDGNFLKLEYTIRKFQGADEKDIVLINAAYIITIQEFRQRPDQA